MNLAKKVCVRCCNAVGDKKIDPVLVLARDRQEPTGNRTRKWLPVVDDPLWEGGMLCCPYDFGHRQVERPPPRHCPCFLEHLIF